MDLSLPSSVSDDERAYLSALRPSRIREVQAGRNGWTSVDLIDVDSGQAVALRGMLELFGVHVRRFAIGQARQLVRALGGEAGAPYVVLVCHGDDGRVVLPALAGELDRFQPLHGSIGPDELRAFARLAPGAVVISTGCDTGTPELAETYFAAGAGAYVAPCGAPFGYASAFAPLLLFYELTEGRSAGCGGGAAARARPRARDVAALPAMTRQPRVEDGAAGARGQTKPAW